MIRLLLLFGTRPEVIKLAPVAQALRASSQFQVAICNSEQQKDLSNETMQFFGLKADYNLNIMQPNQSLPQTQARLLEAMDSLFQRQHFNGTIIQGDTLTAYTGAMASFYRHIPIFHVEGGLRSGDLFSPFPEEAFRRLIAPLATLHFAPTKLAKTNLLREGMKKDCVIVTGNTGIDALHCLSSDILAKEEIYLLELGIQLSKTIILITVHRRENHGKPFQEILTAINVLAHDYPQYQFVFPVHPNPNIQEPVRIYLKNIPNIILTPPLRYSAFVLLMQHSTLICTDSGGLQEEAPSFRIPVLVLRENTERQEGVRLGICHLVGTQKENILEKAHFFLDQKKPTYFSKNPYGDGKASTRIRESLEKFFRFR